MGLSNSSSLIWSNALVRPSAMLAVGYLPSVRLSNQETSMTDNAKIVTAIIVLIGVLVIAGYFFYGGSAQTPVDATQPASTQQTQ
jgi:hypothetical protein